MPFLKKGRKLLAHEATGRGAQLVEIAGPCGAAFKKKLVVVHRAAAFLRKGRRFGKVGTALFQKGAAAFLRFVGEVVEQRGVAGKFLYACLSVEFPR